MTDGSTDKLPQRQWDDAAAEVFKVFMRKIEADNGGDKDKCWVWPSKGKGLPEGYTASRDGRGYGQFGLSGTKALRHKTFGAHRLSYQIFKFDKDILGPALPMLIGQ